MEHLLFFTPQSNGILILILVLLGLVQLARQVGLTEIVKAKLGLTGSIAEEFYDLKNAVFDNALNSFIVTDLDGVIKLWNGTAERTFQYKLTEVLGAQIADLIIPVAYRKTHIEKLDEYRRTGKSQIVDNPDGMLLEASRKDGTILTVKMFLKRLEVNGRIYIGAYIIDKTSDRELITSLMHKIDLLEKGEDLTQTGVWYWNLTKQPDEVTYTKQFALIFDIPYGEVMTAENLMAVVDIDDRPVVNEAMKMALIRGESYEVNYRIIRRNDRKDLVTCKGKPILNEHGKMVRLYGTVTILKKDVD